MLSALLVALVIGAAPQQDTRQQDPQQPTSLPPVSVQAEAGETRRVCRWETVIGSNRRNRICRDLPRQGVQSQETREFMRDNQRVRMPDG